MRYDVFIANFITFGTASTLVFWIAGQLMSWRRPIIPVAISLIAVFFVACIVIVLGQTGFAIIRISRPLDAAQVSGAWSSIEGTVSPADARVLVLVHPQDANKWWVQPQVRKGMDGAWRADINLGEARKQFQLIAVASNAPWFLDLLRGRLPTEGEQLDRPPALPSSSIISVWRSE
jgi:hypothetical protein